MPIILLLKDITEVFFNFFIIAALQYTDTFRSVLYYTKVMIDGLLPVFLQVRLILV
jgi:hypothetical protein